MKEEQIKKLLVLKHKLDEAGIDYGNIIFMPVVPQMYGFEYTVVLENYYGIKVAKLISAPND